MTSQLHSVHLTREDTSIPWGFRLEGGVDIGHAVNIMNINPGSIADYQGLRAGDHVVRINQSDTRWMRHEDAKMEIIRSGNDITLLLERGAVHLVHAAAPVTMMRSAPVSVKPNPENVVRSQTVWQPKLVTETYKNSSSSYETHTSLEASRGSGAGYVPTDAAIGVSHNVSPLPFGQAPPPGQPLITQGQDGRTRQIKHSTYNSPMGLYTKSNRNEAFERTMSSVTAPQQVPRPAGGAGGGGQPKPDSGTKFCGSCGEFIRDVFVKVQGRIPMHPECLKCCKCSVGLRNVGYFYINEKLYCERHAKQAAPPPEPGMKPVVVYK